MGEEERQHRMATANPQSVLLLFVVAGQVSYSVLVEDIRFGFHVITWGTLSDLLSDFRIYNLNERVLFTFFFPFYIISFIPSSSLLCYLGCTATRSRTEML